MSKNAYTRDGLKVSANVAQLADSIRKDLKIGEAGVAADLGKDFFERNLPENISMADVKRVDGFRSDLIAAATLALGETAIDAFKKDKNLPQVSLQIKTNQDKIQVQIDRERKFPNRMGGEGAPDIVRHLQANVRYKVASAGDRGAFKQVRDHLREQGSKIFG